jgi:hypothetical protein
MRIRCGSTAMVLAVIAGCSSGDSTEPNLALDVPLTLMTTRGIAAYSTVAVSYGATGTVISLPNSVTASSCAYDSATQFFVCPGDSADGLTLTRKFRLLDAAGAAVSTYDPLTVVAIRAVVDVQGTRNFAGGFTLQIDRHEDATLSDLGLESHVLNGTATQVLTSGPPGTRITTSDVSVTTDLQLSSSIDHRYPLGGTIVSDGETTFEYAPGNPLPFHREISFDGTKLMTVKTTGALSITCAVDLSFSIPIASCS